MGDCFCFQWCSFKHVLQICCIFAEHLLKRILLGDCFCFQRCSSKQMFYNFAAYLQETFLKEYLGGLLLLPVVFFQTDVLQICCIFAEHLFKITPLGDCFWFQRCSFKQMFYKFAAYLQNTLKEYFWRTASVFSGVLLNRCFTNLLHIYRFTEHLLKRILLGDCFCFQRCSSMFYKNCDLNKCFTMIVRST